jgi:hypothetical protein
VQFALDMDVDRGRSATRRKFRVRHHERAHVATPAIDVADAADCAADGGLARVVSMPHPVESLGAGLLDITQSMRPEADDTVVVSPASEIAQRVLDDVFGRWVPEAGTKVCFFKFTVATLRQ